MKNVDSTSHAIPKFAIRHVLLMNITKEQVETSFSSAKTVLFSSPPPKKKQMNLANPDAPGWLNLPGRPYRRDRFEGEGTKGRLFTVHRKGIV